MTHLSKEKYDLIFEDFYNNRLTLKEVSEKYNLKPACIKYNMSKSGITRHAWILQKYSKSFIEKELLTNTFKELAIKLNLTYNEFRVLAYKKGIKRNTSEFYKKNTVNKEFYTNDLFKKEFYYFVGLFLTDGCFFSKNMMRITIKNKDSYNLLKKLANAAGHNNVKQYKNNYNSLVFSDKGLFDKLISLGIPEKDKTRALQDVYIPNDKDCLYSFLAGALDGDGHIGFQKSPYGYRTSLDYSLCNYNSLFLENLQQKIKNIIGFNSVVYTKDFPVLTIGSRNDSKSFFENMYKISPFYLECKHQIYLNVINKVMI
jgi:hypothetical protein